MKNNSKTKGFILTVGTLVFNYLFYQQFPGVNVLLFSIFIVAILGFLDFKAFKKKEVLVTAISALISGAAFGYHGSYFTYIIHLVGLTALIGFVHQQTLKSLVFSIPTSLFNYFKFPASFVRSINGNNLPKTPIARIIRYSKLTVVPLLFLLAFVFIFRAANPVFAKAIELVFNKFYIMLESIFEILSIQYIAFTLFAISIMGWVIYNSNIASFAKKELGLKDAVFRVRKKRQPPSAVQHYKVAKSNNPIRLKNEYRSALILLVSVNLLLFVVNLIDIIWVWFDFEYSSDLSLSQFVHEGTYNLILSILLSIGILLYYFRKNQNFYHKRKNLVILSKIWIVQNSILVISVALRNYHYMDFHGLAYKRIGVIVFLVATLFGLYTLWLKLECRKSSYYLIRRNSWFAFLMCVFIGIFNWDGTITKFNLSHSSNQRLDGKFLMGMADHTLPLLYQNLEILESSAFPYYWSNEKSVKERLDEKRSNFLEYYNKQGWQSISYLERKTYQELNELKNLESIDEVRL